MNIVSKVWSRSQKLVRLALWMRTFLAERLAPDQAREIVAQGVREREPRFLRKLRQGIYENPNSPYRRLLDVAGCEYGDVEAVVRRDGLDAALQSLAKAGVYLTFEEFKCRVPVIRSGQTFHFRPEDFDDPNMKADSIGTTGGTTGVPVPVRRSFASTAQFAPHWCVFFAANDCLDIPLLYWRPGHAGATGSHVAWAKFGQKMQGWFISQQMTNRMDWIYAQCLNWIGTRIAGFPSPRLASYSDPAPVLELALELLSRSGRVCLNTAPSAAVRLSLAAQRSNASLRGLTCLLGAEALTPARRQTIEASGARATPLYGANEATWIGGQCMHPANADEVHVLRDLHAVIAGNAPEEGEAPPLLFTSLAPITPKILLNTGIGDRGVLGSRRCDCLYDALGCTQTIHEIRSADKITGFGVTFLVSDLNYVVESVLPQRLGGHPGDLQLIEGQSERGLPEYRLAVRPGLTNRSDDAIVQLFLDELSGRKSYYGFMTAIWKRESVLQVVRHAPLATQRGKVLPFHRMRGVTSQGL